MTLSPVAERAGMGELLDLIEKVKRCTDADNALDIAIDIALFQPDATYASVRANAAGTKLIYSRRDGTYQTVWAGDHTLDATGREMAVARLSSLTQDHP